MVLLFSTRERESLLSSIILIFFSRLQGAEARSQLKLFLKFMNPTQCNSRRVSPRLLPIAGDKTKGCNIANKQTGTTPRAPNPNPNPNPSFFPPTSEIRGVVLRLGASLCGSPYPLPAPLPCLLLSFFFCRLYLSCVFFCLFVSSSSRKMPAFAVVAEEEHEENDATDLLHQVRSFFSTFLQLFCVLVRFTSVAAAAFVGFGICRLQRRETDQHCQSAMWRAPPQQEQFCERKLRLFDGLLSLTPFFCSHALSCMEEEQLRRKKKKSNKQAYQ